jgi:hypothetical protein
LGCWTLTSYRDVRLAFDDPAFVVSPVPVDEATHTIALRRAMAGLNLDTWKQDLSTIPFVSTATELVYEVAEPWCHTAAWRLLNVVHTTKYLLDESRNAFGAAERPSLKVQDHATARLAASLPPVLGPVTTQAFVAVSQSLTAFLGNAWAMLLEQRLNEAPLEELLRVAGPSQIQFRWFEGVKVGLCVGAANRDPERFGDNADRIDPARDAKGHLAFGFGPHACIGAMLVRTAANVVMPLFAQHYGAARLVEVSMPEEPVAIRKPLAVRIA